MNPLYEKLLTGYAAPLLKDIGHFYNDEEILSQLEQLSLSEDTRRHLEELIFDRYLQWSTDAFTLGLHLGLSLVHDNVRRGGPQQV